MLIGIKDAAKLVGISILACCAVLVCTMFLNLYFDLLPLKDSITSQQGMLFYDAQVSSAKAICFISGGCLLVTSVIMLLFYIKHYIDTHKKELGILKALGYSGLKIAKSFWIFGVSVLIGATAGHCGAFLLMPSFYAHQNKDQLLPEISIGYHPALSVYLVLLPTAAFAVLAIVYGFIQLKTPVLALLQNSSEASSTVKKQKESHGKGRSFVDELKKSTLKARKTLVFFILFASFCFSSMTQMSASMEDLSSEMMGVMILLIGLVLSCTTLFLAITTVIRGNTKTIAMMRVMGYSQKECCKALLGGYRPVSYLGFALGSVYQYALIRIMVDIVFQDVSGVPAYEFNFPVMLLSLALFIAVYEAVMYCYSQKIKRISLKEIMLA